VPLSPYIRNTRVQHCHLLARHLTLILCLCSLAEYLTQLDVDTLVSTPEIAQLLEAVDAAASPAAAWQDLKRKAIRHFDRCEVQQCPRLSRRFLRPCTGSEQLPTHVRFAIKAPFCPCIRFALPYLAHEAALRAHVIRASSRFMAAKRAAADPAQSHILLFAALLGRGSLAARAAALAALASCLEAAPLSDRHRAVLRQIAPRVCAAVQRPGFLAAAAAAQPDAAGMVAVHVTAGVIADPDATGSQAQTKMQLLRNLAPAAALAGHYAARTASDTTEGSLHLVSASSLLEQATAGGNAAAMVLPNEQVLSSAAALAQQLTGRLVSKARAGDEAAAGGAGVRGGSLGGGSGSSGHDSTSGSDAGGGSAGGDDRQRSIMTLATALPSHLRRCLAAASAAAGTIMAENAAVPPAAAAASAPAEVPACVDRATAAQLLHLCRDLLAATACGAVEADRAVQRSYEVLLAAALISSPAGTAAARHFILTTAAMCTEEALTGTASLGVLPMLAMALSRADGCLGARRRPSDAAATTEWLTVTRARLAAPAALLLHSLRLAARLVAAGSEGGTQAADMQRVRAAHLGLSEEGLACGTAVTVAGTLSVTILTVCGSAGGGGTGPPGGASLLLGDAALGALTAVLQVQVLAHVPAARLCARKLEACANLRTAQVPLQGHASNTDCCSIRRHMYQSSPLQQCITAVPSTRFIATLDTW